MPLLPQIYRTNDTDDKQLKRFIRSFDIILSEVKSKTAAFTDIFDADYCDVKFLPYLANLLGLTINEAQFQKDIRKLIKNAVFIYQRKGPNIGLRSFSEALTGWTCLVEEDTPTSVKIWVNKAQYDADPNRATKLNLLIQYAPDYIPIPLTLSTGLLEDAEDMGDQIVTAYYSQDCQVDWLLREMHFQDISDIDRIELFIRVPPTGADILVELTKDGVGTGQIVTLSAGSQMGGGVITLVHYLPANMLGLKINQVGSIESGVGLTAVVHYVKGTL